MQKIPELLAPAGNLEKLKVAIDYGADAVYLGGLKFGLRAAADNFTAVELAEGVAYAHAENSKVYVVLNGFLHDKDLDELPAFGKYLDEIGVDAVIVSDLGVVKTIKKETDLDIHLSTQASCLNSYSAKMWKKMGVTRIVLGREVSIQEAALIKKEADIEIEMFIHGSMCMAYSGNCTISNFTQGRDSNRGGCAHSCRFEYSLNQGDKKLTSHFMSSKDLNGLRLLEDFIKAGIDSVKVEGRMKSHLYAGTISKVYKEALKYYEANGNFISDDLYNWESELKKFSHRSYAQANLMEPAGAETIFSEREHDQGSSYTMVGRVVASDKSSFVMQVRSAFNIGDKIEVLPIRGQSFDLKVTEIFDLQENSIERTKPSTLVRIVHPQKIPVNSLIRGQV